MPGDCYFQLTVDDGAEVVIDGKTIGSIDGVHPIRTEEGRACLRTASFKELDDKMHVGALIIEILRNGLH